MITALMALAMANAASAAAPYPPSGKWTVEYDQDMCVLRRQFGSNPPVIFGLRPLPLGEDDEVVLLAGSSEKSPTGAGKGLITLYPSGRTVDGSFTSYAFPKDRHTRLTTFSVDHDDLATLLTSDRIAFDAGNYAVADIATGDMTKALTALQACQDDLLKSWGVDPAEADKAAVRAKAVKDEVDAFGVDDYPAEALRAGEQGHVIAIYTVGPEGRAHDCRVVVSSKSPSLDKTTCQIVDTKLRYHPALDAAGQPIASLETVSVVWRLQRTS